MDARLLEILVCPLCKGPLKRLPATRSADGSQIDAELLCSADRLAFPVRDGIPVMLVDEARKVSADAPTDVRAVGVDAPPAPDGDPD